MAISWGTAKSLLLVFGPFLLPKIISYYRQLSSPDPSRQPIQPLPPQSLRSILMLAGFSVVLLVRTLPIFSPENIFTLTSSRLQIPTDVLFTRLATLRAEGKLTRTDEALRTRFVNLESRLLYLARGPKALVDCLFCSSDEPNSYLYYSLPDLLTPHLINLAVLTLATSGPLTAGEGVRWRTPATVAAAFLAMADLYLAATYNHQANARALRLSDLDLFHWRARALRLGGLAVLDAVAALVLYLSSTRRMFAASISPADRVLAAMQVLAGARSKLNAAGIVKNTTNSDGQLSGMSRAHWGREVGVMSEVMEEREVVEGVQDALGSRIDIARIEADAEAYATNMLQALGAKAEAEQMLQKEE